VGKTADLDFLKAGSSDYPVALLRQAGVDTTTRMLVDTLLSDFGRIISQMEQILRTQGKIE
jgi:oligoendopeptidase F